MNMQKSLRHMALATALFSVPLTSLHAAEAPPPTLVTVATVEAREVAPVIWVPANVISRQDSQIASERAGQIVWVAEIGSRVKRGEPLARIDDEALKLELAEQQAVLSRLQASETYFEKQLQRLQTLIANNSISRNEIDATERDLAVTQANIEQQKVLIARSELAIKKARITAPFDGVVAQRRVQRGEYVQAGQPVAQLVDLIGLDVQAQAPISVASFLAEAKALSVEFNGDIIELPLRTWTPTANLSSRAFELRLDARNLKATPGMAVKVAVPRASAEQTLVIPRDALVIREQATYVMKVNGEGIAERTVVTTGAGTDDKIAVSAALNIGDQVIVRGAETTQHGQKVRVAETKSGGLALGQR